MKRPRPHVIEDESEKIFRSLLPKEWIIRKIEKDYGIDYEVEIVEGEDVTGDKLWFQLKGTESICIQTHRFEVLRQPWEEIGTRKYFEGRCIAFQADTKLLKYSLRCDIPLLLGVVDIRRPEVYWLPIQDEIKYNLEPKSPKWKKQLRATVRIPIRNSFSNEKNLNYPGLRWYSVEPKRMRHFASLYHSMPDCGHQLPSEIEKGILHTLNKVKSYMKQFDEFIKDFGDRELITLFAPVIQKVIELSNKLYRHASRGKKPRREIISCAVELEIFLDMMKLCFQIHNMTRQTFLFGPYWHYLKNMNPLNLKHFLYRLWVSYDPPPLIKHN